MFNALIAPNCCRKCLGLGHVVGSTRECPDCGGTGNTWADRTQYTLSDYERVNAEG